MDVPVRDLKSRLSEYLRRVAAGEEILVTSHGREVARLLPPRPGRRAAMSDAQRIAQFRALPWVRAGGSARVALPKPLARIRKGEKTLAEMVSEQRG